MPLRGVLRIEVLPEAEAPAGLMPALDVGLEALPVAELAGSAAVPTLGAFRCAVCGRRLMSPAPSEAWSGACQDCASV